MTGRRAALSAAESSPLDGLQPAPSVRGEAASTTAVRHRPPFAVSNTATTSPVSGEALHDEYGRPPAATSGGSTRTVPDVTHTTETPTMPRKSTAVSPRTRMESEAAARSSDASTDSASRSVRRASDAARERRIWRSAPASAETAAADTIADRVSATIISARPAPRRALSRGMRCAPR